MVAAAITYVYYFHGLPQNSVAKDKYTPTLLNVGLGPYICRVNVMVNAKQPATSNNM